MSNIISQNLRIYIPSLNRPKELIHKTLKLLNGIDRKYITIVVSNRHQLDMYRNCFHSNDLTNYSFAVSNTTNIGDKRNYIKQSASEEYIVQIDDDITKIVDNNGIKLSGERIWAVILKGFEKCVETKTSMFGMCGYSNPFFLRESCTTDQLKFLCGNFMGFIQNEQYPPIYCPHSLLEDYYFSCKHFLRDGGVVKFQALGCETRFAKNKGGIQSTYSSDERLAMEYKIIEQMLCDLPNGMMRITDKARGKNITLNRFFTMKNC